MNIVTNKARAYVNFGRWIADCPIDCGSAMRLNPRQAMFHCVECRHVAEIEWPANADELWDALEKRQAPKNRNWFPAGHPLAVRASIPHGQTVKELEDETRERSEV